MASEDREEEDTGKACPDPAKREKGCPRHTRQLTNRARGEKGTAQADVIRPQGLSKAEGFNAQKAAIGATSTALVNIASVLAEKGAQFVPQILAVGGWQRAERLGCDADQIPGRPSGFALFT